MDSDAQLHFFYRYSPREWTREQAVDFFRALVGDGRIIPATRWGREYREHLPPPPELWDFLANRFLTETRATSVATGRAVLTTDSSLTYRYKPLPADPQIRLSWETHAYGSVPAVSGIAPEHLDDLIQAAALSHAVELELDYNPPGTATERTGLGPTYRQSMHDLAKEQANSGFAYSGPFDGLWGISWMLVLGRQLTEMFGEERLKSLPPDLAWRHEQTGLWVLQTAEQAEDSITDIGRANEARIIELLGPEHFMDRDAGRLATVKPVYPEEWLPDPSQWPPRS